MEWACRWLWPVVVYLLTCSHTHETLSGRIYGRKARLLNLNIIGWLLWECRWHRAPRIPRSFLSRATRTNPRASRLSADEKITRRDKDLCLLSKRTREQTVSRSAIVHSREKNFSIFLSLSLSLFILDKMSAINNPTCTTVASRKRSLFARSWSICEFPYNHRALPWPV